MWTTGLRLEVAIALTVDEVGEFGDDLVDMSELPFLDCAGYSALVEARTMANGKQRTVTVRNQRGQPARFLDLVDAPEHFAA